MPTRSNKDLFVISSLVQIDGQAFQHDTRVDAAFKKRLAIGTRRTTIRFTGEQLNPTFHLTKVVL
jgi:hypothetical protein